MGSRPLGFTFALLYKSSLAKARVHSFPHAHEVPIAAVLYFPSKVHIIKNGQISYRVGLGQHCRRRCCEEGNVRCQPMARLDLDNQHYHHYHHHYHYHSQLYMGRLDHHHCSHYHHYHHRYHYHSQLYMGRLDHHHCSHHHHYHHHPSVYVGRLDHHQGNHYHHHYPSFYLGRLDHHQGNHHHHPSFFLGRLDFYHD